MNLDNARTDSAIRQIHTRILLIHGTADNETSPNNSILLAHLNPRWTALWLVPGARHTGAYAQSPQAFEAKVLARFGD